MNRAPEESPHWNEHDAEGVARDLREQIAAAKRRMQELRDGIEAVSGDWSSGSATETPGP
jgi:hypothetical protein